ncbi:MAG: DUF802 domain-containing protein [Rhodoferax sp.]|nr:DUF802 domain-containing protein [Rhodoferax sp.]
MNKHFFTGAFALGFAAVAWVASGFVGTSLVALLMTLLIAAVYGVGALELYRYQQATQALHAALISLAGSTPAALAPWLAGLPTSVHNAVRLRVAGERLGLPGPALTPYLVGLLVMLGMLGTFLGMVVTLNGAAFSLQGEADLPTIRAALAAPIKGLGLAFGTSVAGVASSAMLGLMSVLVRRARQHTAQLLDDKIATDLHPFTQAHQRQQTDQALQQQAHTLPQVVTQLQHLMSHMTQMNEQLHQRLLAQQDGFHSAVAHSYTTLATSVEQSLRHALNQSAQAASDSLQPLLHTALQTLAQQASQHHQQLQAATAQQLSGVAEQLNTATSHISQTWRTALAQQQSSNAALAQDFAQHSQALLTQAAQAQAQAAAQRQTLEQQQQQAWAASLQALSAQLQSQWQDTGAQQQAQQLAISSQLTDTAHTLTKHLQASQHATLAELTRLMDAAAAAPRAAAEVIAQLREHMSHSLAQDNTLLEERSQIMATLHSLLTAINHASKEQREVIDTLVASATQALSQTGQQFAEQAQHQSAQLGDAAAQVACSAIEVASLGETFGFATQTFSAANDKLLAQLQRTEAALSQSQHRSDEQMAYYVAQAREIIDLSLMAQKDILAHLNPASVTAPALAAATPLEAA